MQIKSFVFNPFMENTYVLYDETNEAIIIDPGCYAPQETDMLKEFISAKDLKVVKLVNTHCHIDHVLGNYFVKQKYGVPLYMHDSDQETLKSVEVYAPSYGFQQYKSTSPDHFFNEGDTVEFGNTSLDVIFLPGHAPGHVVLFHKLSKQLIGGDVLFRESIGRTDLPGGNHDLLIEGIQQKLFKLPEDTTVYPGHGDPTTVGHEMSYNPFCAVRR